MKKFTWRSPSNIALVKYWGKHGVQLPRNPSLSFTLQNAYTETSLELLDKTTQNPIEVDFYFENQKNTAFQTKIEQFLTHIQSEFSFLNNYKLRILSQNSFPHSAGIASSASSMSALALCLCSAEAYLTNIVSENFYQKASHIARLGSGSACRSVFSTAAVWGKTEALPHSSDTMAVPLDTHTIHPVFRDYKDSILIVSKDEKKVSSRAGHALMNTNPYAHTRYQQANRHLVQLLDCLQAGNLEAFIEIVEKEALTLHALMMASTPPFILLHPNTLRAIEKIQVFRHETNTPVCFTLDAGPNIHLLYPAKYWAAVQTFIQIELKQLCQDGFIIEDEVGQGASKID